MDSEGWHKYMSKSIQELVAQLCCPVCVRLCVFKNSITKLLVSVCVLPFTKWTLENGGGRGGVRDYLKVSK